MKKTKLKKILAFAAINLFISNSYAWTLVYETDVNGDVTAGSLETLRTAINNGATLKVLVTSPNSHVFHVPCQQIHAPLETTQAVVCYGSWQLRLILASGSQFGSIVGGNPSSSTFIMNTLGQYAQVQYQVGTNTVLSSNLTKLPMRWYVD